MINNKDAPILQSLNSGERKDFLQYFDTKQLKKDQTVFNQGEKREKFYILLEGKIELYRSFKNEKRVIHIFKVGDFLAEASLLAPGSYHTVSARAKTDCSLLVLPYQSLKKLEDEKPLTALKVIKYITLVLQERLYHADNKLTTLFQTGSIIGSSENIDEISKKIIESVMQVIYATTGVFILVGKNSKAVVKAASGYGRKLNPIDLTFDIQKEELLKQVVNTKQTIILDQKQCQEINNKHVSMICPSDSAILSPVIISGEVKGIFALFNKKEEDFNLNNKVLLEAIASQVGASLVLRDAQIQSKAQEELKRVYY